MKVDTNKPITLERKVLKRFYDPKTFIEHYKIRYNLRSRHRMIEFRKSQSNALIIVLNV